MNYADINNEETLKFTVAQDFFSKFGRVEVLDNIDFAVKDKNGRYLLWAEAKIHPTDLCMTLTQLVLTIGKARTFDKVLPPPFLGCFDREKIAFVPYADIQDIFYQSDFNWKVAPSNQKTREFQKIYAKIKGIIERGSPEVTCRFYFSRDTKELKEFLGGNFIEGKTPQIRIDKTNFIHIYTKWREAIKPTIAVNWDVAKKYRILDADFYLADLLSEDHADGIFHTIKKNLFVVLNHQQYELRRNIDETELFTQNAVTRTSVFFTDEQQAHTSFWAIYKRPPLPEYWDYIMQRRDLLVPQDVRERKGSFFTPRMWVELSQKYIADALGKDWQDEYVIWDCAAGTGNLLVGLTSPRNIWASTLDQADVDVMRERINHGANLYKDHVFQFDFLNDDFSKLPEGLRKIIQDEKKRKKLVIYINPPYAEAGDIRQRTGTGKNKTSVAQNRIHDKYHSQLAGANRQLFAQFLIRIYNEIPNCKIGEFSKLKTLSGAHFKKFRENFRAKLFTAFIVPADTFDNVVGKFPIGFKVWDTGVKEKFETVVLDVFDEKGNKTGQKGFYAYDSDDYFSNWVGSFKVKSGLPLGWLQGVTRNDFHNQNGIIIKNKKEQIAVPRGVAIYDKNLMECCVCFAVRMCIPASWLNDCDQFLHPADSWKTDVVFQNDCLIYTLFNHDIQSKHGMNHWIPFTENEVNARDNFDSHFMSDFIAGKTKQKPAEDLFTQQNRRRTPLVFSREARAVLDAGKALWTYYLRQPDSNVNAGLHDIREYFQGRNAQGRMNNKSDDNIYNGLIGDLREALKVLAGKIEPKIYEHGFLKA